MVVAVLGVDLEASLLGAQLEVRLLPSAPQAPTRLGRERTAMSSGGRPRGSRRRGSRPCLLAALGTRALSTWARACPCYRRLPQQGPQQVSRSQARWGMKSVMLIRKSYQGQKYV